MEKALFWLTNTSSTDQTVELFNTKEVGVTIASPLVFNITQDTSSIMVGALFPAGLYMFVWRRKNGSVGQASFTEGANFSLAQFQTRLDSFTGTWTITDKGSDVYHIQGVYDEQQIGNDFPNSINTSAQYGGFVAWAWDGIYGLGPAIQTDASNTNRGYFSIPGSPDVSVESYNDFSYSDFVWSLVQRNYYVQKFEVFSESHQQLLSPFLFDRTTATGRVYQKVATPTIDPYQNQNVVDTPYMQGYLIDGFTSLKYVVKANQTLRFIMYYEYADLSNMLNRKKDE